ncbi:MULTISPECIES: DUF2889 domain-containing protein [Thalassospira]|jgi:hypothetical protein|uniref:DUF2889 domain-containing protein n=1 Tax=Thalassospira xiamenensis TaxID=220697 RepID=A0A367XEA2_9PROT|nr:MULTISPECIES: DUF2889 domain-containing protein [Thalassospira]KZB56731.1 hypothetical protein AUP41_13900 [Thalassospira xiamenensis]MAZ35414.1 DUF2889 domain-containing protein [Thalassospira sp.]MBO9507406.1 DUF2889 domain-containing protein [Thalassospira sp. A3_1]MCK2166939.1 DUF2889 domain-containing protein [Thalassospira xiamenensis]RCK31604.1 hypothetical protein TH9_17070 [Thalassospira xiamenensis]
MPLSSPAAEREHIHTRNVTCTGYRRKDGLWDIEGHITDTKTYGFENNDRGEIPAGVPIHEMWLRITVGDDMVINAVEAVTDHAPFNACDEIAPNYEALVGLRIGPGLKQQIRERVGGIHGCTHLTELMGPVATTAFQTIFPIRAREAEERRKQQEKDGTASNPPKKRRSPLVNSCHGWRSDGAAVKRIAPDMYTGD